MICNQAKELFQPLADGQVTERERRDLEEHLGTCASCRAEAERTRGNADFLREHLSSLRELVKVDPSAVAKTAPAPPPPAEAPPPRRPDIPKRGAPLALAFLIVVVAGGVTLWAFVLKPRAEESRDVAEGPTPAPPGPASTTPPGPGTVPKPVPPGPRPPPKEPGPRPVPAASGPAELLSALLARPGQPALASLWTALEKAPDHVEKILPMIAAERDEGRRALLALSLARSSALPRAREALFSLLGSDGSASVRGAAAASLAAAARGSAVAVPGQTGLTVQVAPIEDEDLRGRLLAAAEGEREPALLALFVRLLAPSRNLDPAVDARLLELLASEDDEVRQAAVEASRLHPPKDPQAILVLLRDNRIPGNERAPLVQKLFEADPEGAVALVADLATSETSEPLVAAALASLANPKRAPGRGVEAATAILRGSATIGLKTAALQVLAAAGRRDPGVLPLLEDLASSDPEEGIRDQARTLADRVRNEPNPEEPGDRPPDQPDPIDND